MVQDRNVAGSGVRDPRTGWIVGLLLAIALILAGAVVALRREAYPGGSFLNQERTVVVESVNPDLDVVLAAVVIGETPIAAIEGRLGEPTLRLEADGYEVWVYSRRFRTIKERAFLGLIPTGSSQSWAETKVPVGVKDGMIVYVTGRPNTDTDTATREAVLKLWSDHLQAR